MPYDVIKLLSDFFNAKIMSFNAVKLVVMM